VVILFLFAIMGFPVSRFKRDRIPIVKPLGMLLILILCIVLLADLFFAVRFGLLGHPFKERHFDDALRIGRELISSWLYPFELVSVLLLVAVVAVMYLAGGDLDINSKGGNEKE